ncbi:antA/AntB antirepressor family protein [Actinobacillus pleuropneumoniae]|uniref:antA/AntB antirepressor family protein n=1 Tax=Actinobacillus pleuropneumoniae TaxID=715 RepID=UPI003B015A2A
MKTTQLIPVFTGQIKNIPHQLCNARDLHEFLQIKTKFQDWISRRISDYNFVENLDFIKVLKIENVERGFLGKCEIEIKEYHITLDMAKELGMIERTPKGKTIRQYFIECERKAQQSQAVKSTIEISTDKYIELLETQNQLLKQVIKPQRYKLRLSADEKSHILSLHQQGLTMGQIVQKIGRSETAVRSVIRQNGDV